MTMSWTATTGRSFCIGRHVLPRSRETCTPCSVPTNSRLVFLESSSITYTGEFCASPADRFFHVLPPSVVLNNHGARLSLRWPSNETYAVLASVADATMRLTHVPLGTSGIFASTCVQVAPALRVSQTFPSSVPAHIVPFATGDSDTEKIVA